MLECFEFPIQRQERCEPNAFPKHLSSIWLAAIVTTGTPKRDKGGSQQLQCCHLSSFSPFPLARLTSGERTANTFLGVVESDFAASPLTASGTFLAVSAKIPAGDCCNAAHHTPSPDSRCCCSAPALPLPRASLLLLPLPGAPVIAGCWASRPAGSRRPSVRPQRVSERLAHVPRPNAPPAERAAARRDRPRFRISFPSHATPQFQTLSGLAAAWTLSAGPLPYPAEADGASLGSRECTMKTSIVFLLCISVFPGFSQGRVVRKDETGFAECNVFFSGQVPPEGFTEPFHVKICQQYNKEPRFATLYSTKDKIPLYSAFKFTKPAQSEEENWLVEPQVRQLFLC